MPLLIILFFIALWVAVLFFVGSFFTRSLNKNKSIRKLAIFIFICVFFTLPIIDEIKGAKEFEELCEAGGIYQISPGTEGKKFDFVYGSTPNQRLTGYARPVEEISITYTDAATGKVIATAKAYVAHGGWLVRTLGFSLSSTNGPLLGRNQCFPTASERARLGEITNKVLN